MTRVETPAPQQSIGSSSINVRSTSECALSAYEASRAKRQYDACEPENRLVARTVEHGYEQALIAVERERRSSRWTNTPVPSRSPTGTAARWLGWRVISRGYGTRRQGAGDPGDHKELLRTIVRATSS